MKNESPRVAQIGRQTDNRWRAVGEKLQDFVINGKSTGRKSKVCRFAVYTAGFPDMD